MLIASENEIKCQIVILTPLEKIFFDQCLCNQIVYPAHYNMIFIIITGNFKVRLKKARNEKFRG